MAIWPRPSRAFHARSFFRILCAAAEGRSRGAANTKWPRQSGRTVAGRDARSDGDAWSCGVPGFPAPCAPAETSQGRPSGSAAGAAPGGAAAQAVQAGAVGAERTAEPRSAPGPSRVGTQRRAGRPTGPEPGPFRAGGRPARSCRQCGNAKCCRAAAGGGCRGRVPILLSARALGKSEPSPSPEAPPRENTAVAPGYSER